MKKAKRNSLKKVGRHSRKRPPKAKSYFPWLILTLFLALAIAGVISRFHKAEPIPTINNIPVWSNFLSRGDYMAFTTHVEKNARNLGLKTGTLDQGYLQTNSGVIGLLNLSRFCRQYQLDTWPRIIDDWFKTIAVEIQAAKQTDPRKKDFNLVKDHLKIRLAPETTLGPPFHPGDPSDRLIFRKDNNLEGTVSLLVYDYSGYIQPVKSEEATAWGKTNDELFALAAENNKKSSRFSEYQIPFEGGRILILEGDQFFTASEILWLDRHSDCLGKYGAMVCVPDTATMMYVQVNDSSMFNVIERFISLGQNPLVTGPQSLPPNVYWYHENQMTLLPYEYQEGNLILHFPDSFNQILAGFSKEKKL